MTRALEQYNTARDGRSRGVPGGLYGALPGEARRATDMGATDTARLAGPQALDAGASEARRAFMMWERRWRGGARSMMEARDDV
jgi:hypothetical protein